MDAADIDEQIESLRKVFGVRLKTRDLLNDDVCRKRRAGSHPRKKDITSQDLRIVLSRYRDLIGRYYIVFRGKATLERLQGKKVVDKEKGDCLVLFFSDRWKGISKENARVREVLM